MILDVDNIPMRERDAQARMAAEWARRRFALRLVPDVRDEGRADEPGRDDLERRVVRLEQLAARRLDR